MNNAGYGVTGLFESQPWQVDADHAVPASKALGQDPLKFLIELRRFRHDDSGHAGEVEWNFEKFLVAPDGSVVGRFRPTVAPDAPELVEAIEAVLPG